MAKIFFMSTHAFLMQYSRRRKWSGAEFCPYRAEAFFIYRTVPRAVQNLKSLFRTVKHALLFPFFKAVIFFHDERESYRHDNLDRFPFFIIKPWTVPNQNAVKFSIFEFEKRSKFFHGMARAQEMVKALCFGIVFFFKH